MPSNSASEKGRENKIYRTPSTPPPDVQLEKEKGFVLDCSAVSSISTDYSKTNPKLGPVIPPYNSQKDKHVDEYFEFIGVNETLEKTGQVRIFFFLFLLWRSHLCKWGSIYASTVRLKAIFTIELVPFDEFKSKHWFFLLCNSNRQGFWYDKCRSLFVLVLELHCFWFIYK